MREVTIGEIRIGNEDSKLQATQVYPHASVVNYLDMESDSAGSMPLRAWLALPYWEGGVGHLPDGHGDRGGCRE